MRYPINYTKTQKIDFETSLRKIIIDVKETLRMNRGNYRNTAHCEYPFPCEYLEMCATKSEQGYTKKENLFSELDTTIKCPSRIFNRNYEKEEVIQSGKDES